VLITASRRLRLNFFVKVLDASVRINQAPLMTTTTATETAILSLLLTDSQILASLGSSELTVDGLVCGATAACEARQMTVSERDRLAAIAIAWRDGVH
jgi:hypothetical protein